MAQRLYPEQWAFVPGYEPYEASTQGRIRRGNKILRPSLVPKDGLGQKLQVGLTFSKKKMITIGVGKLVLLAFIGTAPEGRQVRHFDDIPWHNGLGNLAWGTRIENGQDASRNERLRFDNVPKGEGHRYAKLTEIDVKSIRNTYIKGQKPSQRELGRIYGVNNSVISNVLSRKTWKHVK